MRGSRQAFRAAQLSLTCRRLKHLPHPVSVGRISSVEINSNAASPSPGVVAESHSTSALPASSTGSTRNVNSQLNQIKETAAMRSDASIDVHDALRVTDENTLFAEETTTENEDLVTFEEPALTAVSEAPGGRDTESNHTDVSSMTSPPPLPPPRPPPQSGSRSGAPLSPLNKEQDEKVQVGNGGRWAGEGDHQAAPTTPTASVILEMTEHAGPSVGRDETGSVEERKVTGETITPTAEERATKNPTPNDERRKETYRPPRPPPIITNENPASIVAATSPLDVFSDKEEEAGDGVKSPEDIVKSPEAAARELAHGCFVTKSFSPSDLGLGEDPVKVRRGSDIKQKVVGNDGGDIGMWFTQPNRRRSSGARRGTADEVSVCYA